MKKVSAIIVYLLGMALILFTGCTSGIPNPGLPVPDSRLSTIAPSAMVLQVSDLPPGYEEMGSKEIARNGFDVKKGHEVVFVKRSDAKNPTVVGQKIHVISTDTMDQALQDASVNTISDMG